MNTARPLDAVASIKVKLGLLVAVSVVVAVVVAEVGDAAEVPWWASVPVTVAAALAVTQWLARGMTSPLREMTGAARAMAGGDYSQRVTASSADEVGDLAVAFNAMAADLAAADQERRRLVATVSHELRTPLAAQRALLENLVDGVVSPDDEALRGALRQSERLGALVADLLDLSRLDAGVAPLAVTEVRVADLRAGSRVGVRDQRAPRARCAARPIPRTSPWWATPPGSPSWWSTSSTTRSGTARPAVRCWSAPVRWTRPPGGSRSATRARASPPRTPSASSNGSAPEPTRPAAPASDWPSRDGCASCTAATITAQPPDAGTTGALLRAALPRHAHPDRSTHPAKEAAVTPSAGPLTHTRGRRRPCRRNGAPRAHVPPTPSNRLARRVLARARHPGAAGGRPRGAGRGGVGRPHLAGAQRRPGGGADAARGRGADVVGRPLPPPPLGPCLRGAGRLLASPRWCATRAASWPWPSSSAWWWPPPA